MLSAESQRLAQERAREAHWYRWGPYLAERQWGTVREDYSAGGAAWDYLPHDHARSRAYRWGEDGIAGISDNHQRVCLALALWNGNDAILKERMFGVSGTEGNHGEDCKEYYYYLDNTPSHAYMRMLYKYPQGAFPYAQLVAENRRRARTEPEYELIETGIFDEDRYFDVEIEYAKADVEDLLMRITVTNRGPAAAPIDVLPTLWFRNTWAWPAGNEKPVARRVAARGTAACVEAQCAQVGLRRLYADRPDVLLFTENETNNERLFGVPNAAPYVKDGINAYVVDGSAAAVNPRGEGTKVAARWRRVLGPAQSATFRVRFSDDVERGAPFDASFDATFALRRSEADAFYAEVNPYELSDEARAIQRQAFAGLLWSKQWYYFVVRDWLAGDGTVTPPASRREGRNSDWAHLYSDEILSMPDTWEYPWFAAWDLAFHVVPLALIDAHFAKRQLLQLTREWFMHPNGQLPAYEWAFGDVNPPVHAWAAYRVFKIDEKHTGSADYLFLERVFQKLLLNFTWWVNRKDRSGRNVFQGGFLGLDNIGIFDRSAPLPTGGHIDQSDGTSWMAFYALLMMRIALELARHDRSYEDVASKFFEHFLRIAHAMNELDGMGLWHEGDGFYYDVLHLADGTHRHLPIRSLVGLLPLLAVETLEPDDLAANPDFARRMEWFIDNRPEFRRSVACMETLGAGERRLLAIVWPTRTGPGQTLRRRGVSERPRRARSVAFSSRAPVFARRRRTDVFDRLRTRRIVECALRGKLELARTGVVPDQLFADRSAAEISSLFRGRSAGRGAHGLGKRDHAVGGCERDRAPAHWDLHARCGRPAAGPRRRRTIPNRSAVARSAAVLRIFPRRRRSRHRGESPDWLDWSGRETSPAVRRVLRRVARPTGGRRGSPSRSVRYQPAARNAVA
jgi:hypothetical protein